MEDVLRAIVLGIVQGLTEFLPISSSGHLILVRELLGWEFTDDLTFDVSLHLGTTIAVVGYFSRDWIAMTRGGVRWLAGDRQRHAGHTADARLLFLVVIGSVPIAIIGFLAGGWLEEKIRSPEVASLTLIAFGLVLLAAERLGRQRRDIADGAPADALAIGASQAISLIPGVSRSGITISAGLFRGLDRTSAARFSFLLSTPAIGGAALLKLSDAASSGALKDELDIIVAGAVTSAIVGWLAVAYLMRFIQTRSFIPFVVYRIAAGVFFLVYFTVS